MKRNLLLFGLWLVVATISAVAAGTPAPVVPAATNTPSPQVIAYYFHGTVRCETCLKIEKQAREVIGRQFKAELNARRLVFKAVNYDLPENAHFQTDYNLPCPSLVLVRQKDGRDEKWTLLGDTWQLIHGDPAKFNRHVETEVGNFLRAANREAGS
jgi:hypothetical protein